MSSCSLFPNAPAIYIRIPKQLIFKHLLSNHLFFKKYEEKNKWRFYFTYIYRDTLKDLDPQTGECGQIVKEHFQKPFSKTWNLIHHWC